MNHSPKPSLLDMLPTARKLASIVAQKTGAAWLRAYPGDSATNLTLMLEIDDPQYKKIIFPEDLAAPDESAARILDRLILLREHRV